MVTKHTEDKKLTQEEEDFFECLNADPTSLPGQQPFHKNSDVEDSAGADTSSFFAHETAESPFESAAPVHADAGKPEAGGNTHWLVVAGGVLLAVLAAYWFFSGSSSDNAQLPDAAVQSEQVQGTTK